MLSFIRSLKNMVRSSNAVAVITFPTSLPSSSLSKRWHHMEDTLLAVRVILDENKELSKLLTGYHDMIGFLHVHKVAQINTQVAALDSVISKGVKVADTEVLNLIEMLMTLLIKLYEIIVDGDVKIQRRMQVKRVQNYVETLDLLKIKNAAPSNKVKEVSLALFILMKHSLPSGTMPPTDGLLGLGKENPASYLSSQVRV